jgi:LuxR family transcriptional regulator, maltose regulon positive regulatory protein
MLPPPLLLLIGSDRRRFPFTVAAGRGLPEIQYVYPLIHNKVTSPQYVTPTLRRARLIDWLNAGANCRAMVLAADAGYGKTTLLWQWEREVDFPCYWYKLDRNDRDWSLHVSYLIEAISQRHPGFGQRAHSMLEQLGGPGSSRPGVAAYLLAEMHERLTEPCTFIIDDWQFVASATEVRGLWNQILRDAPPACRFVFLSRAKPQLQFARFKTHAGYAELRTDALRFTDREIEELFRDIYNDPLAPAELAELERRTEGWAASLQLVEVSLRERHGQREREAFINSINGTSDSDLVEFLAQEVLDQQPGHIRNFLLSTSILQEVEPELGARLAGAYEAASILADLENQGLFTYRLARDEATYRYHGLFRGFLERHLQQQRLEGEVTALHIHAASYYETHERWPDAIHHYMAAGLQPQAARLIAKFGEDLVAAGRIGMVDGWLQKLPVGTVKENARLSLLVGEALGIRGEWRLALEALQRARMYFSRKRDYRLEALACMKLSTVHNNLGDVSASAEMARLGLKLAPTDATATRLRLRGNLAVTRTWLDSLEEAERECKRIAVEAAAAGFDQFAAIAHHNLGVMLRYAGRLDESQLALERAASFWDASPTNPFADNYELVTTLLLRGNQQRAREVATAAVRRTEPWPKPNGEARLGLATVLLQEADFDGAAEILRSLLSEQKESLGAVAVKALSLLIEVLYLADERGPEMRELLGELELLPVDPRLAPTAQVAAAIAAHGYGQCEGRCAKAGRLLSRWERNDGVLIAALGRVQLALLALEHHDEHSIDRLWTAVSAARSAGGITQLRWWLRRLATYLPRIVDEAPPSEALAEMLVNDPAFWQARVIAALPHIQVKRRPLLVDVLRRTSSEETLSLLSEVQAPELEDLRRELTQRYADRLLIRSLGGLAIYRGGWDQPPIYVTRRRARLLLGLLVANFDGGLVRDQVIEILWPDADPGAGVNSLNQTVFQLRRLIDPAYREGESPQYIVSTVEVVQLNRDLVTTDLREARHLARTLSVGDPIEYRRAAASLVEIVRGEFLSDLKYEDWVGEAQVAVHAELRTALLPLATNTGHVDADTQIRAACALAALDPFDEVANIAVAQRLSESGRRVQARAWIERYARRVREELDEEPSGEVLATAALVGAAV